MNVSIDIVSDFICPWCFIGKKRLKDALVLVREKHPDTSFQINWLPYFLGLDTPSEGVAYQPFMEAKFGGARVFMKPAAPGTGVKAGGAMRAVFESVGISDVLAKSKGSSNPHNLVKATVAALTEMRDAYTVAGLRGIPMERVFKG